MLSSPNKKSFYIKTCNFWWIIHTLCIYQRCFFCRFMWFTFNHFSWVPPTECFVISRTSTTTWSVHVAIGHWWIYIIWSFSFLAPANYRTCSYITTPWSFWDKYTKPKPYSNNWTTSSNSVSPNIASSSSSKSATSSSSIDPSTIPGIELFVELPPISPSHTSPGNILLFPKPQITPTTCSREIRLKPWPTPLSNPSNSRLPFTLIFLNQKTKKLLCLNLIGWLPWMRNWELWSLILLGHWYLANLIWMS